jgi:hypothetical protein
VGRLHYRPQTVAHLGAAVEFIHRTYAQAADTFLAATEASAQRSKPSPRDRHGSALTYVAGRTTVYTQTCPLRVPQWTRSAHVRRAHPFENDLEDRYLRPNLELTSRCGIPQRTPKRAQRSRPERVLRGR